jgi:hypothetical protein
MLNWPQDFEAVVQCEEVLVELLDNFEFDLDMSRLTHTCRDQIPRMGHP